MSKTIKKTIRAKEVEIGVWEELHNPKFKPLEFEGANQINIMLSIETNKLKLIEKKG